MKYGRSLQELAIELDRQAKVKKDYVATAGAMQMTAVNENFDLVIGNTPFQLNENAHRQLGLQLKIPAPYYERMRAENPGLLMANVNGWFQQSPDTRRMVRTLDGTARAILSDRYRRIDNYEVAQTVLPIISEMQGARIESCELTDTRMYIKVVNERIQTEVVPGDIVQAGILISNSEVGMGSVSVKPLIYRLVCTNGMVADVGVGKRHVGRINESVDGDFGIFRDETIEADDRAFLMKIEDTVRAAVDEARFNALVQKLRDAKEAPILPAAAPKVVELAAKEFNIRQNESEGILGHLIAGGDLSLYGLANAVTRHAQDVQSYDRSTELEATGYKIITIDAPHITDRQIHKVISKEVLEPLYDPSMIYDNGASRIGKGLHWQIKRIKQQLARHYRKYGRAGGVLLLDLKKFFPYAPHSIIYQRHQRYILNPDFRRIADTIIDTAPGEFPGRGMPLGVEPSQQEMAAMPSAVDNWIKCQMSTHSAGHYMDDYCIILPDIEDLKKLGRAIVRQFEIRGIPVNKKKCKIIPLTKPFRWCKARFTLTETGKIKVNGSRDGVIRARRKLKLFHREWLAGKRTLQEVAQYMNCQEAYYKNFDDHGRLLRLRRLCYAIFGGKVPCSKSSKPVMAPSLP